MCFDKVVEIPQWTKRDTLYKNAWELFQRKEEYRDFYYYYEDITRVVRGYPNVHFRHLLTPQVPLNGGFIPIYDDVDQIEFLLNAGETDTRKNLETYLNGTDYKSQFPDKPKVKKSSPAFDAIRQLLLEEN